MAVDMFIKIGDIKGESKDDAHKEEVDVLAWSWSRAMPTLVRALAPARSMCRICH
jgi:type VI protein secretion system component Hcp